MLQTSMDDMANTAIPAVLSIKNRIPSFVVSNFLLLLIMMNLLFIIPILMVITYYLVKNFNIELGGVFDFITFAFKQGAVF